MDGQKGKWIALVPAYEPTSTMLGLLKELKEHEFEVVVVNDGSDAQKDEIFLHAAEYATVLKHDVNHGKGCALKTGLAFISEHFDSDYVVATLDADGQHRVEDAVKLCTLTQENPSTVVLGSRHLNKNVPLRSRFGNTVTRFVFKLSTERSVYDTQTGLRAFSAELVPFLLSVDGERYEYEMNVLLNCARENIPISEVEIETIYIDGNASSHFNAVKDSYRVYKEILKFSASSFVSFLVDYGLYSLLNIITHELVISNVGARLISASVNYTINRNVVFKSHENRLKSACGYALLALFILAGNTLVLSMLVNYAGINRYIAKVFTEMLFFVVSWSVQKYIIFCPELASGQKSEEKEGK